MADTIAVLSQKGGTGKTTTVRTLTDALRRSGVRTLAIDLDPQGNLSDYFDVPPDAEPTIADVLSGRSKAVEAIHGDLIPANLTLAEAELMLGGKMGRELTLRRALGIAALRLLELHLEPIERVARLVDLAVEAAALRRRIGEDREEAGPLAAHLAGL